MMNKIRVNNKTRKKRDQINNMQKWDRTRAVQEDPKTTQNQTK